MSGRGLDTNVLLRFLLNDHPSQSAAARSMIDRDSLGGEPPVVCLLTLLEAEWVLRTAAKLDKAQVVQVFHGLLESIDFAIDDEPTLEEALHAYQNTSADFADCLINARYRSLGCGGMVTFDTKAARLPGAKLLGGPDRPS
ncbi:MAG TPA: type II toxin-antitoxin system VapC family toxin [Caulobacteraceae bacterium]|nr:type II toxin-antitoxin system VapC family toxin [Caulobacteraceae bacterium]